MSNQKYCKYARRFKRRFANTTEAQPRIDEVYAKSKLRLYTYWCPACKCVHLSKHAAPKNRRWA